MIRRWINLLLGDWLPHDDLRREGFLDLDTMVGHRIFDEGFLNRTVGHSFQRQCSAATSSGGRAAAG